MTNEAILSTKLQDRLPEATVADGTAILKGTVLQMTDPNTASASSATGEVFMGIAYADKVADDGATKLSYYSQGIFEMTCDATGVTAGDNVKINGANLIGTTTTLNEAFGVALQTGAASETILVRLGL